MEADIDQSCFSMGETFLRESRIDDAASVYEASLTPESVIEMRMARRQLRAQKKKEPILRDEPDLVSAKAEEEASVQN